MATPLVELRTWRRVRVSLVRERADQPYAMRTGADVAGLVREFLRDDPRERFVVVYLDGRNKPIAVHDAHIGSANNTAVHPREVFGPAVALSAVSIVVAHNHPSGDAAPSECDRAVTQRLRDAGELLGIGLLDHVVLGSDRYYSFADEGVHAMPGGTP